MASTNKTTHYELSQYVGSDKPTYLVDYNQDMSKIDAGIYGADAKATENNTNIGTLSNLTTTEKSNLVGAINEVDGLTSGIGNLSNLTTTAKTDLVVAVNEVNATASKVGDLTNLTTTNKASVVGAINEVNSKASEIGTLSSLTTTEKSNVVGAINEVNGNVGDITNLNTTEKSSIVGAVNEVNNAIDDLKAYLLYDNTSGANGTITLSDSVENYTFIDIFYKDNQGLYSSTRVFDAHGKSFFLTLAYPDSTQNQMWIQTAGKTASGTQITSVSGRHAEAEVYNKAGFGRNDRILITHVVGYKH